MSDHEAADTAPAVESKEPTSVEPTTASTAKEAPARPAKNNLEDALFGDDDDDDEEQVRAVQRNSNRQSDEAAERSAPVNGGGDDDDDDEEDQAIRRKVRRPRQRVASASASPPPTGSNGLTAPPPLDPSSPVRAGDDRSDRSSRSASPYGRGGSQELDDDARRQLEYKEDDEEDLQPDDNIEVAHLALPQLPVRRTKEHWLARIPHFLRYVTTPFDADTWDDEQEEKMLLDEGFNSGFGNDVGAASLLRTSNTIRWRYTDQVDEDGAKVPESNARIVRWSDGTMSLQVGSELFDITQQTEKGRVSTVNTGTNTPQQIGSSSQAAGPSSQLLSQATQSMPMGSSGSANRPAQSLSYLVVPHEREQVIESQGAIAGSLAFTPADTQSETHRRIAKALRFQKTARVVATAAGAGALDPEVEKARIEKELKDAEKKRIRERQKEDRKSGKFDDDMFDVDARRRSRYTSGRKAGAGPRTADYYSDESDLGAAADEVGGRGASKRAAASQRYAEDDDDGFIVDDEGDEDEDDDGQGRGGAGGRRKKKRSSEDEDAMEVDDEPDEMELAEQKIEEAERARKKAAAGEAKDKPRRPEPAFSSDEDEQDAEGEDDAAQSSSQTIAKKKRIIESDEE
ncbi:related to LEO1-component of the Paf1 complex [Sporisorium reilianum f. sp. reilianum]|uniref:Related to LEO1-component of the Paf1 complex n=1 Tax=Sporisorium reilianum f. sp. reilianum TaxID=72559 RepID=A0A2N8UKH8_9BASI|nr:related to LEO1-component of the Paf1 complex [Sporisorium reilianum f. sp. reilianum]